MPKGWAFGSRIVAAAVASASAQPRQNGLVDVNIEDVTVQAPISGAANLCDISVAALVGQFNDTGDAECTATAESIATNGVGGNR